MCKLVELCLYKSKIIYEPVWIWIARPTQFSSDPALPVVKFGFDSDVYVRNTLINFLSIKFGW